MRRKLLTAVLSGLAWASVSAGGGAAAEDGLPAWLYEVKVGLLNHDMPYLWSHARNERGVDFNGELIFAPGLDLFGGAVRAALGASINSSGGTSKAYLDLRYMYEFDSGIFLSAGAGGAIHNGELTANRTDRKELGSRLLFHTAVEAGYRFDAHHSVSLYFDHISNAGLARVNDGLDTLGLRYGYRFRAPAKGGT